MTQSYCCSSLLMYTAILYNIVDYVITTREYSTRDYWTTKMAGLARPPSESSSVSPHAKEEVFLDLVRGWLNEGHTNLELVVVGEAGQGKSSLINGLLGKEVAKEGGKLDPETQKVKKYLYTENGVAVALWDTPGFGVDTDEKEEETLQAIKTECAGQVDLLLYCIRMDNARWPKKDDIYTIRKMTQVLGHKIWQCCQFVLTFANQVPGLCPPGEELEQFFSQRIKEYESSIRKTLMKHANLAEEDVQEVRLVPVGDPHKCDELWELPGIEDWFVNFWLECTCSMHQQAVPNFFQLSKHRMTDVPQDVNSLNPPAIYQHPIPAEYAQGIEPRHNALECPDPSPMPSLTTHLTAITDQAPDSCETSPMPSLTQSDDGTKHPTGINNDNSSISLVLPTPPASGCNTPLVLASCEEGPDDQAGKDEPRPQSSAKPHNRQIGFYQILYRQMKNKQSGFVGYVKHYWKHRGEAIPVFGHVGGLLEGITQWLECSLTENMKPDKGMPNTCEQNYK